MFSHSKFRAALLTVAIVAPASGSSAQEQSFRGQFEQIIADYLSDHPEKVEAIVKNYLAKNPQVLAGALSDLLKRPQPAAGPTPVVAAPKADAVAALTASEHQVVLGNPTGKITLVEFFDYNCGYCKRALGDTLTLLRDEPDLRIVLKEFPILGPGSMEAAQVAIAVRMQDRSGEKYLAFHQKLLGSQGYVDKAAALSAATDVGLDQAKLLSDLETPEVTNTLAESMQLAQSLGINGTPSYIVGGKVIPGAIGAVGLKQQIKTAAN